VISSNDQIIASVPQESPMSTTSRLAVSAAVLASGLLLAAPAAAQEACPYPFTPSDARCQVSGGDGGGATDGEGTTGGGEGTTGGGEGTTGGGEGTTGGGEGTTGGEGTAGSGEGAAGGGTTGGSGGGTTGGSGGAATVVDNSPVRNTAGSGGGAALPFTGGEVTLIALAGAAAVGGGVVLVAAGRKRATG
jgi:hypothetical protein